MTFCVVLIFNLLILILCSCHKNLRLKTQKYEEIKPASRYEYTFIAIIEEIVFINGTQNTRIKCDATLIDLEWIITSALCIETIVNWEKHLVTAGVLDTELFVDEDKLDRKKIIPQYEQSRNVSEVKVHPKYNNKSYEYDLAMVKVVEPFDKNRYVSIKVLPKGPFTFEKSVPCYTLRYEKLLKNNGMNLYQILQKPKDNEDCIEKLKFLHILDKYKNITEKNFCLFRPFQPNNLTNLSQLSGYCEEMGGPCICGSQFLGVVVSTPTYNTCYFSDNYPAVGIDIGYHLDWVGKTILDLQVVTPRSSSNFIKSMLTVNVLCYILIILK